MKFTALIATASAVRVSQKTMQPTEAEFRQVFNECAGDDQALQLNEAIACARQHGHADAVPDIRAHWPRNAAGQPESVTFQQAVAAFDEHQGGQQLAQEPTEEEIHQAFLDCAGEDQAMQLNEAVQCARQHGHGDHADAIRRHWPRNENGQPRSVTWEQARQYAEEHERQQQQLAQGADLTPQAVRQAFLDCAGQDRRLTVDEAAHCATQAGHGNLVADIRAHWPQENGAPMVVDLADARRFYESHEQSLQLAQRGQQEGNDTMDDPRAIFNFCAGDDGILEMQEAQRCAARHVAELIGHHWPRDDNGAPARATFEDVQRWMQEHA